MTRDELKTIIRNTAEKYGFTAITYQWTRWLEIEHPAGHYLNFKILEEIDPNADWKKREINIHLHFRASLAFMGELSVEELIQAADVIRAGALLMEEMESLRLVYTETA